MTDVINSDEEDLEMYIRQRVRLFTLSENGNEWCEIGIGQISACTFLQVNETYLIVNAESDDSVLLESKILQDTAYMKQQERFIIWTENEQILGLSFQENAGCNDVWEIICQVQGKDPYSAPSSVIIKKEEIKEEVTEDVAIEEDNIKQEPKVEESANEVPQEIWFEEMLDIEHAELTSIETDVLNQLIELVNRLVSPSPEDKVPPPAECRLLDLYRISEDIEETEGLQQLHETILYLLSFNRDRQ